MTIYLLIVKHLSHKFVRRTWTHIIPGRIDLRKELSDLPTAEWTLTAANSLLGTGEYKYDEDTTFYLRKVTVLSYEGGIVI